MTNPPPVYGPVARRYGDAPPPTYAQGAAVHAGAPAALRRSPVPDLRAGWTRRAAGFAIDAVPGILGVIALAIGYPLVLTGLAGTGPSRAAVVWSAIGGALMLVMLGWAIPNRWIAGGRTGRSLGRRVMGVSLLSEQTGEPVGAGHAFLRDLVHCLDVITVVGFLWPLWDERRQTFADMVVQTAVVVDDQRRAD